jgi:hypothetical protein
MKDTLPLILLSKKKRVAVLALVFSSPFLRAGVPSACCSQPPANEVVDAHTRLELYQPRLGRLQQAGSTPPSPASFSLSSSPPSSIPPPSQQSQHG